MNEQLWIRGARRLVALPLLTALGCSSGTGGGDGAPDCDAKNASEQAVCDDIASLRQQIDAQPHAPSVDVSGGPVAFLRRRMGLPPLPATEPARVVEPTISSNAVPQPARAEQYYAIMARAAGAAYPKRYGTYVTNDGTRDVLRVDPSLAVDTAATSPDAATVFTDSATPRLARMVLAVRGTVIGLTTWADVGVDIESQFVKKTHATPFEFSRIGANPLPAGRVGGGWEDRWYRVAALNGGEIPKFITSLAAASRAAGDVPGADHIEIDVVGHSLGAVTAELAGLDIEDYLYNMLADSGMHYEVNVVAFNPPKLGSSNLVTAYRNRLQARPANFRISVFTRQGDIVDDVPTAPVTLGLTGFYHQVINNVLVDSQSPICSRYMAGSDDPNGSARADLMLPYAPRFHVTKPFPYGAHSIDDWVGPDSTGNTYYRQVWWDPNVLGAALNPRGVRCMFAPDSLGSLGSWRSGTAMPPLLSCTPAGKSRVPDDCGDSVAGPSRDEL